MIDGFKLTIKGAELISLCTKQADFHRERSKLYGEQLQSMIESKIEMVSYSGSDPKAVTKNKAQEHEEKANHLAFCASHILADENYLISVHDLRDLGVHKQAQ